MRRQAKAYLFAILSVLCWSTVATAFKLSLRHLDFLQLLCISSTASMLVLGGLLLIQGRLRLLTGLTPRDFCRSATLGFLNPFLYYLVLFKAYSLLPAQEAQPLNYTWPVMIVMLSIPLLRQPIRRYHIAAVLVSFAGVVIISTHGDPLSLEFSSPLGVGLAVGSSVIWALFWIYNVKDGRDEITKLFLNFLFGTVYIVPVTLLWSDLTRLPALGVLGAVYVGLFEMGLTFVFWLKALRYARTTAQVSNLVFLSPFLSLFLISFIVGERIVTSTVVGLVCIIGGIAVQRIGEQGDAEYQ